MIESARGGVTSWTCGSHWMREWSVTGLVRAVRLEACAGLVGAGHRTSELGRVMMGRIEPNA